MGSDQKGEDLSTFIDKYPSLQTVKDASALSAPKEPQDTAVVKREEKKDHVLGRTTIGDPHRTGLEATYFTTAMSAAISEVSDAGTPTPGNDITVNGASASKGSVGGPQDASSGGGGSAGTAEGSKATGGTPSNDTASATLPDLEIDPSANVALAQADLDYGPDDVNIDLDASEKAMRDEIRAFAVSFYDTERDRMEMDGLYSPRRDRIAGAGDFSVILGKITENGIAVALHERLGGEIARESIKAGLSGSSLSSIAGVISSSMGAKSRIDISKASIANDVGNKNAQMAGEVENEGIKNIAAGQAETIGNNSSARAANVENGASTLANMKSNDAAVDVQKIEAQSEFDNNDTSNEAAAYAESKANEGSAYSAQVRANAEVEASYNVAVSHKNGSVNNVYGAWASVIAAVINSMGKPGVAWVD